MRLLGCSLDQHLELFCWSLLVVILKMKGRKVSKVLSKCCFVIMYTSFYPLIPLFLILFLKKYLITMFHRCQIFLLIQIRLYPVFFVLFCFLLFVTIMPAFCKTMCLIVLKVSENSGRTSCSPQLLVFSQLRMNQRNQVKASFCLQW